MKAWFVRRQYHDIIGIPEIIPDAFHFLDPVIEVGQVKIGEILAEVVADWQTWSRVDDLVQEPQQILILKFPPEQALEDLVGNCGIKLADV